MPAESGLASSLSSPRMRAASTGSRALPVPSGIRDVVAAWFIIVGVLGGSNSARWDGAAVGEDSHGCFILARFGRGGD
jgi:hypothetical protein